MFETLRAKRWQFRWRLHNPSVFRTSGGFLLLFCLHSGLAVQWVKVLMKWRISLMWIDVPWFLELVLLKSMLSGLLVKSRCARYQCSENGANEHLPPSEMDPVQFYTFKRCTNKGKTPVPWWRRAVLKHTYPYCTRAHFWNWDQKLVRSVWHVRFKPKCN